MHRQASGAPRAPMADLESPFRACCGGTLPVFTPVVWLAALQADIGQRRLSNKGMVRAAQGGPLRPHHP